MVEIKEEYSSALDELSDEMKKRGAFTVTAPRFVMHSYVQLIVQCSQHYCMLPPVYGA